MSGFDTLPLSASQLEVLRQMGFTSMTPIQAAALPLALAGHDLIARASTGSGKTAAFTLPLLARLDVRRFAVQTLVLCPTRELAEQVAQEIRRMARAQDNVKVLTLCGGNPIRGQLESLAHGAHIIVGTPGRIMDHLQRGSLDLAALNGLVLDEADRMLDMGFHDDIAWIAEHCPASRQTLLFSATYPERIAELAARFLREPKEVLLDAAHAPDKIRQNFYLVQKEARFEAASQLLRHFRPEQALVFCNTRAQCRDLCAFLEAEGFDVLTLHGELEQQARSEILVRFANRSVRVLVATDVAARGLDISGLDCVLSLEPPADPAQHVHRIGRTGRADADGLALNLLCESQRMRTAAMASANGGSAEPEWQELPASDEGALRASMSSLLILAGKRDKLRPGDVLGALTADGTFTREQIGKISIDDSVSIVAVQRALAEQALRHLVRVGIKGRRVRVRALH